MNLDLEKMELINKWTENVVKTIEMVRGIETVNKEGVEPCGIDMNRKTFEILKNSFTITPTGVFTWFGLNVTIIDELEDGEIFVWGE